MAREAVKRDVLLAIARNDGEWNWYQLDRELSGRGSDCIGPFSAEIDELSAEGLIEVRPAPDLPGGLRYWLTDAGRAQAAEQSRPDRN